MSKLVYLAGPISGCSFEGANDWREEWIESLYDDNIECLSPMRGKKDYLHDEEVIKDHYSGQPLCEPRAIMSRDYFDANRADVIVFNVLGAKKPSVGTAMEAAWGFTRHIPMVWIIEADGSNPHHHAMLDQCMTFRTDLPWKAMHIVRAILNPLYGLRD